MDHFTHFSGPVAQPSAESDYNAVFTELMAPTHSRIIDNAFMNKDPYVFT